MITRRIRFPLPRQRTEPPRPPLVEPTEPIIQHETGGWSVGYSDDAPVFESRAFAAAVAAPRGAASHG
jgi:hypothetical protein